MLWTLIWILLIIWILGLIFKVAGGLIHIVLLVAVIIFIVKLVQGRGRRRG
ncbi:lmo0937 family membrane protein [Metabacillus sp. RGM 3146]|uniref:lmo0937 family membrane protein n=1 Tax=Metabacillus sp. RGM 3146 TaxID=3401092 RepID=UPI003B9B9B28